MLNSKLLLEEIIVTKKIFLSTAFALSILLNSGTSQAFDWPEVDSSKASHKPVVEKFISNAKNQMNCFKYTGHLFKVRGGSNQYTTKNNDLYNKAMELEAAYLNGNHIKIIPTSSSDVFSHFEEKCLYKILINGKSFVEGFRVYNADNEFTQPKFIVQNNNNAQQIHNQNVANI